MIYELEERGASWKLEAHPKSLIGQRIGKTGRPYEWPMLDHIADRELGPGCVVDVGAHIGNHTLYFAKVLQREVWAFEPLFHKELWANIRLNGLGGIVVAEHALGAESGRARDTKERVMDPGEERKPGKGQGTLYPGRGHIVVKALDSLDLPKVALMKLDIEGWEHLALRGAVETIERDRPLIYTEAATKRATKRLEGVLHPLDYRRGTRFVRGTPRIEWLPN